MYVFDTAPGGLLGNLDAAAPAVSSPLPAHIPASDDHANANKQNENPSLPSATDLTADDHANANELDEVAVALETVNKLPL